MRKSCALVLAALGLAHGMVALAATLVPTPPAVDARSFLLEDFASGRTLAGSNVDERLEPASLTKMMTVYAALSEMKAGKIDPAKISIIWKTPTYPDYQWSLRGDVNKKFGPDFKAKVTRALLGMKDPDLLASFPRKSFVPASNADYQPILDTGKSIGLID